MKLIVRQTGTIFDFCESTNGTDYDGIVYGGNSVKLAYTNDTLTVSVDSGENKQYPLSDLNYDDGNEIIGFTTMLEFVTSLKAAGFTGNFNLGGVSPQNNIPLTGTETRKPVTGDIEIEDFLNIKCISSEDETISGAFGFDAGIATMYAKADGLTETSLNVVKLGVSINTPETLGEDYFGLTISQDISEQQPTDKNIVAQRAYVERPETLISALNNCDSTQLNTIKTILGI